MSWLVPRSSSVRLVHVPKSGGGGRRGEGRGERRDGEREERGGGRGRGGMGRGRVGGMERGRGG